MLKRILMMLMALMLLMCLSAGAEEVAGKVDSAVYRIYAETENGEITLGSGVLLGNRQTILTAASCWAEGALYAAGSDGVHPVTGRTEYADAGVVLLELAEAAAAESLTMAGTDTSSLPFIFGVNEQGDLYSVPLYMVRNSLYHDHDALLLTAEEGVMPGGFMTDDRGDLVGMVIARHAEGIGGYVALDVNELEKILSGKEADSPFLKMEISWENGMLKLTWKDQKRESGIYSISLSSDSNNYYTTYNTGKDERSIELAVPPGHTYYAQVQWAENADHALPPAWDEMKVFTVPSLDFDAYCFAGECYLASAPAGKKVTGVLKEMPLISVDTLMDEKKDIYLQISSTYDVSAVFSVPMAVELAAPDGQFYYEEMQFTFSPEYETEDVFPVSVDELLMNCSSFSGGAVRPGAYAVRYFLNGRKAGEYAFTVQEAGTPLPEEEAEAPVSGFAGGVKAVNENGLVTLTWDQNTIPDGAKVSARILYEGNSYYTYHNMENGAESTQFFAVPGRRLMAWVVWALEGDAGQELPQSEDQYVLIEAVKESPLLAHSFRNLHLSVYPSDDPEHSLDADNLPVTHLTRDILSNRETPIYFCTRDTYRISKTSSDHPMVIVLFTPEGYCFADAGYYIFDLTMQENDMWHKDISKLFADYEALTDEKAWPAGEYRILYCIDEKVAGELTFTLD